MKENYSRKTAQFLETFVGKEGYKLIKTEFVNEDGNWYLRAYIDLTEEEKARRKEEAKAAKSEETEEEETTESETVEEEASLEEEAEEEPGIGINDCALVSRRLSKWLDKEDFIDEIYTLEVCSPGYLNESNENVQ